MKNKKFATRTITTTLGIIIGIAGFNHGFFESLQGLKPTDGLIIQAIGESIRWWKYGTEEAFTIVPNFLITGILAMAVSIFVIVWSIRSIHKKHGPTIFLMLCILLFLVGGGIGQVVFFLLIWAYSTRLNKPINWWRRVLPEGVRNILSYTWLPALVIFVILFLAALEIAIFGYFPGVSNPDKIFYISWLLLLIDIVLINVIYIGGFAYDLKKAKE